MKNIEQGSKLIAAVICRVVDYHVVTQALAVAQANGFDDSTREGVEYIENCVRAEERLGTAIAAVAHEVEKA